MFYVFITLSPTCDDESDDEARVHNVRGQAILPDLMMTQAVADSLKVLVGDRYQSLSVHVFCSFSISPKCTCQKF